ncbi:hypothetical protein D9M68_695740 [compost metagenome]
MSKIGHKIVLQLKHPVIYIQIPVNQKSDQHQYGIEKEQNKGYGKEKTKDFLFHKSARRYKIQFIT